MARKYSRKFSTRKVVVKPKVIWTLAKRTDSDAVYGPKKNEATGKWDLPRMTTFSVKSLIKANTDTVFQPGLTKKIKHLKIEIARSFVNDNAILHKSLIKMKCYVLYMPQGVSFSTAIDSLTGLSETIANHPEWVIAEKVLNCNFKSDASTVTNAMINCKLSRNLKSGDQICLVTATTYDTSAIGDNDISTMSIPYNIEWNYAQSH